MNRNRLYHWVDRITAAVTVLALTTMCLRIIYAAFLGNGVSP